jgi:hypothetical protein
MAKLLLPVLVSASLTLGAQTPVTPVEPPSHLVKIRLTDGQTMGKILALDLDLAACCGIGPGARDVEVIADDADVERIRRAGLDFTVAIRNLEDHHERQLSAWVFPQELTPPVGQGAMGGHYTLDQIVAHLDAFARDHPAICSQKFSLGKSHEGRDIWAIKISDNVSADESEPEVLFDAMHHAREPVSATTTLVFMDWLLDNYGTNAEATWIVDHREMWFVPCLNPDGFEYNRATRPNGGGMWRKNRRNNGGGIYGVDINRNWTTGWTAPYGGNSTSPSSDTYRGPSPQSEPEIQALDNFIKGRKFVLGHSCHTYTEVLLYPWGYQTAAVSNAVDYQKLSTALVAQSQIRWGPVSTSLYIAAGAAADHYHAAYGMYGFTAELGTSSEGGFWPTPPQQIAIANRHQYMFRQMARLAGAAVEVAQIALVEGTGGNNNGRVDPGERGLIRLTLDNKGSNAPTTNVLATLRSAAPGVTIQRATHDYGRIARFTAANNDATPLEFSVASAFAGLGVRVAVDITYEDVTETRAFDIAYGTAGVVVATDFERNQGFAASGSDTATSGRFERAAPQETQANSKVVQPGADHTPGAGTLCWVTDGRAGASADDHDVDGGHTTLLSPLIDLRHVWLAQLSAWVWFFEADRPGDAFTLEVSNDGGQNWRRLWHTTVSTQNGWQQIVASLADVTATDNMQVRFRAEDATASLVEALVDDLEIRGVVDLAALTLLGSGQRATNVSFALHGSPAAVAVPLLAAGSASIDVPGVGKLLLDPASLIVLPPLVYASNTVGFDLTVPNEAGLVGKRFHWQQLLVQGTKLRLGNASSFQVR